METGKDKKANIGTTLYKLVDIKQPEVKWALGIAILLTILLLILAIHSNFNSYEGEICNILHSLIGGIIAFISVAVAGIAIVIVLFTPEQIETIEKLEPSSFEQLLYDFKLFGLFSAIETAILVATILIIRSSYPVAPFIIFYLVAFFLIYTAFYLIFYGSALIGNCIKLSRIKFKLNAISELTQDIPVNALSLELDFLVSKLFQGDRNKANAFYTELIQVIEQSAIDNRDEILQYLKNRYSCK